MTDPFASWRAALAGEKPPIYETEPWCGYFAVQNRDGVIKSARWPKVAAAIWPGPDGTLIAQKAKVIVPFNRIWPYCAKTPISYEIYQFWFQNERWPEEADAA